MRQGGDFKTPIFYFYYYCFMNKKQLVKLVEKANPNIYQDEEKNTLLVLWDYSHFKKEMEKLDNLYEENWFWYEDFYDKLHYKLNAKKNSNYYPLTILLWQLIFETK